jgi:hypothetical protein
MLHSRRVPILARSSREKWGFIGLWVAQRFNVAIKIPKPQPVILSEVGNFRFAKVSAQSKDRYPSFFRLVDLSLRRIS